MSNEHRTYNVAIIGGGMSGLITARILQRNGHSATVFEHEAAPAARLQGGSLDIHRETGQHALEIAGLTKEFRAYARPEGQGVCLMDKTATILYADEGNRGAPPGAPAPEAGDVGEEPEVDRGQLRQILLDSLTPNTVQWSAHVSTLVPTSNGPQVRIVFEDPSSSTAQTYASTLFDIAIGADGTWSHIRSLLTPVKPDYGGVVSIEASLHNVDADYPDIAKMVGHGMLLGLGDGKGLVAQRNSGSTVRSYAMLRVPLAWVEESGVATMNPDQATTYLLNNHYADWDPRLKALLNPACSPPSEPLPARPFFQLPNYPSYSWSTFKSTAGDDVPITLVGDAAHVMVPSGEGANLALLDGAELGLAIHASSRAELKSNVAAFEKKMMERAALAATEAMENMSRILHEDGDGAQRMANWGKMMSGQFAQGGEPLQEAK